MIDREAFMYQWEISPTPTDEETSIILVKLLKYQKLLANLYLGDIELQIRRRI